MTQTLGELLRSAAQQLQTSGIEEGRREARLLAMHAFGFSAAELIMRETALAPRGQMRRDFDEAIARRAAREPLQHIQGTVEFFGLELFCDARALIPRPDSEIVVEAALDVLPKDFSGVIADLGTGSGCLLLACLAQRPNAHGIGVEASAETISLVKENARRTGLETRAEFVHARWEDWQGWGTANLIISNPPYIPTEIIDTLQTEVREYDPVAALDGGADGLAAYRSLFACGVSMKAGAFLVIEIGYDQAESVPMLAEPFGFGLVSLKRDLGSNPRALTFRKGTAK